MPCDYTRYPPNWKTEIVPAILERANQCCEECGLKNGQAVWSIKLWVKDDSARYKLRSLWFRSEDDAKRESVFSEPTKKKVVLTISHTDHDETNWDVSLDRLKALCQLCHLRYDAKEKYRRSQEKWKQQKQINQ